MTFQAMENFKTTSLIINIQMTRKKKSKKIGNEEEKQGAKTIFVACDTWPLYTNVACDLFFFSSVLVHQ